MALVQINGATQIRIGSITDDRLAEDYIKADGSRAFVGNQSLSGFRIVDLADPVDPADAATRGFVYAALLDTIGPVTAVGKTLASADTKASARAAIDAESVLGKGQPNGYASLDGSGKIPVSQIPPAEALQITKSDIGLGDVDNTSDATKWAAPATLANKTIDTTNTITVKDSNLLLQASGNSSRQARISAAAVASSVVQTYMLPSSSTTLAGTDSAQNLTNKTISGDLNVISDIPQSGVVGLTSALAARERIVNKGQPNGYAPLDGGGRISPTYLPSYIDGIQEFPTLSGFPNPGEFGKIYVAADTSKSYRWSGSMYSEISPSPGSTDSVTEGSVNLYFTNARADARIGAAIGTEIQPYDATLSAWADKTVPAGTVVGTSDSQTLTEKTIDGVQNTLINIPQDSVSSLVADLAARELVSRKGQPGGYAPLDSEGKIDASRLPVSWSTSSLSTVSVLASKPNFTQIVFLRNGAVPTLPSGSANNRFVLKNAEYSAGVTIYAASGETIEGQSAITIVPRGSVEMVKDGLDWSIIS